MIQLDLSSVPFEKPHHVIPPSSTHQLCINFNDTASLMHTYIELQRQLEIERISRRVKIARVKTKQKNVNRCLGAKRGLRKKKKKKRERKKKQ